MKLKIGQHIYQYSSRILEYEITGINELTTDKHIEQFYIAKCLSCRNHEPCIVAFKKDDHGNLIYSHMINGYDEDDEYYEIHEHYRNSQYYWHKNENHNFFLRKKEAQIFILNKNIKYYEEKIENIEKTKEEAIKEIEKNKTQIEILSEK